MMIRNRIGRFKISKIILEKEKRIVESILNECQYLAAKHYVGYYTEENEYYAISKHFEEIDYDLRTHYSEYPLYDVVIDSKNNDSISFIKVI